MAAIDVKKRVSEFCYLCSCVDAHFIIMINISGIDS
jgi:hypothetical protein